MKTGLGIYKKYRLVFAYYNLFKFWFRKTFIGFDVANQFIQRVDKISLQCILKKNGASIGRNCDIETGLVFHNCLDYSNLIIDDNCHIGKNCFFDLRGKITIENNVVISMNCALITHIDMNKSNLKKLYTAKHSDIVIKNNTYIGINSTVLMGVQIGDHGFVASGSIVSKDVEMYTMVGGIPAKKIKRINGT